MNIEEFLKRHDSGVKTFENENLIRLDLSGMDLRGFDFTYAALQGSNLEGADLEGATLKDADLSFTNLRGANLRGANLQESIVEKTDFTRADLTGANLKYLEILEATPKFDECTICDGSLPAPEELIQLLLEHANSPNYDQSMWCGTKHCLAGAAGAFIGNQSIGVLVIAQVLPEFNLNALYSGYASKALRELCAVQAAMNMLQPV